MINKIDYDVLSNGITVYANQATALDEVITALNNMNAQMQEAWTNETSSAFIERYESEHKIALQNARDAIQSISDFIASYVQNRQEEDAQSAAGVRG